MQTTPLRLLIGFGLILAAFSLPAGSIGCNGKTRFCGEPVATYCERPGASTYVCDAQDYTTALSNLCNRESGSSSGTLVVQCGAYVELLDQGIDTSSWRYYDRTTGALVASGGSSLSGEGCTAGSSAFEMPACTREWVEACSDAIPIPPEPSTLTIDGAACTGLDVAREAPQPGAHLWRVTVSATCPVLGAVLVLAQGDDNVNYSGSGGSYIGDPPVDSEGVELVVCSQTDAGTCGPADLSRGQGTYEFTRGPSVGYEKAPIAFTATLSDDGSPAHDIAASLGRGP
ncbi:MAG TPA: hypothetical protein VGI39_33785 [Polyangiaceae bacterium]|jgi:hypothetical protein